MRRWVLGLMLAGCGGSGPGDTGVPVDTDDEPIEDTDTGTDDTDTGSEDTDTGTDDPLAALRLPPPEPVQGHFTAGSEVCADCHSNAEGADAMRDAADRPVGPVDLWRASAMAHSASDPLFRATLAAERVATPAAPEGLEAECMACHAPLAHLDAVLGGEPAPGAKVLERADALGALARDGASCLGCHLQDPENGLGDDATWSGHHPVNDRRVAYGPHASPFAGPMRNVADVTPAEGGHVLDGDLCASCHTLQTAPLRADGSAVGHLFTEQAPYVEWRSSDYDPSRGQARAATCQTCHLPMVDADGVPIRTAIARNPAGLDFPRVYPREPYGRHLLVGGNTLLLEILRDHGDLLGSPATPEALDAALDATRASLRTAARLVPGEVRMEDGTLTLPVTVVNETGHKLPTGYPARRLFLRVIIRDAGGRVVFESGATDARGRLLGPDGPLMGEAPGDPVPGHVDRLTAPDQVAAWYAVMGDEAGRPTTTLLRGTRFVRDDRLLPHGFDPTPEDAPLVAPVGVEGDSDFGPGGDTVTLAVPVSGAGPFTVDLSLHTQAFTPRFLDALRAVDTPESRALDHLLADRTLPVETLAEVRVPAP
jgi:hypothetical protein